MCCAALFDASGAKNIRISFEHRTSNRTLNIKSKIKHLKSDILNRSVPPWRGGQIPFSTILDAMILQFVARIPALHRLRGHNRANEKQFR